MIVAAGPEIIVTSIAKGFANVAFTGSLLLTIVMTAGIFAYGKRRPVGTPLSWGQAMVGALYVSFVLVLAFGIVPDRWLVYAASSLNMRSDAILAGPGSTGWLDGLPIVISKQVVADLVAVNLYMVFLVTALKLWGVWQNRGKKTTEAVATSNYGRPLVKA